MITRKKARTTHPLPADWTITDEARANGRILRPGTEFRVRGERGRFKFERHVTTSTTEWIDARDKDGRFRAFAPDRIATVHVQTRLRPGR